MSATRKIGDGVGSTELAGGDFSDDGTGATVISESPPNLLSYLARPIAGANDDGDVDGGTAERLDGETPALAMIALPTTSTSYYMLWRS